MACSNLRPDTGTQRYWYPVWGAICQDIFWCCFLGCFLFLLLWHTGVFHLDGWMNHLLCELLLSGHGLGSKETLCINISRTFAKPTWSIVRIKISGSPAEYGGGLPLYGDVHKSVHMEVRTACQDLRVVCGYRACVCGTAGQAWLVIVCDSAINNPAWWWHQAVKRRMWADVWMSGAAVNKWHRWTWNCTLHIHIYAHNHNKWICGEVDSGRLWWVWNSRETQIQFQFAVLGYDGERCYL